MTTLNEIEARLGHLHDTSICTAEDCFRREHGDLLIRALRKAIELEPQLIHHELFRELFDEPKLALLEEGRSAE